MDVAGLGAITAPKDTLGCSQPTVGHAGNNAKAMSGSTGTVVLLRQGDLPIRRGMGATPGTLP
jgi:hypothetical protein